jgi:hypothetical protein
MIFCKKNTMSISKRQVCQRKMSIGNLLSNTSMMSLVSINMNQIRKWILPYKRVFLKTYKISLLGWIKRRCLLIIKLLSSCLNFASRIMKCLQWSTIRKIRKWRLKNLWTSLHLLKNSKVEQETTKKLKKWSSNNRTTNNKNNRNKMKDRMRTRVKISNKIQIT